jgi:acyl-CoA synthetase (AMP-forming)/AMP-acid ligase II
MNSIMDGQSGHLGADIFATLRANPQRTIVVDDDGNLTAADILNRAQAFAAALARHGCGPNSRIMLCLPSNIDALCGSLGAWLIGGAVLMVDFRTPASQRAVIAKALEATLVVEARRPAGEAIYDSVIIDDTWRHTMNGDFSNFEIRVPETATAYYALSSGTTGTPKIYVQSHGRIRKRITEVPASAIGGQGLFLTPMSMSFTSTRSRVITYMLGSGRVRFMPPVFSTGELIETIHRSGATGCGLPPPVIRNLVREIGEQPKPFFPKLNLLRSSGGPATPEDKIAAYRNLSTGYCLAFSSNIVGVTSILSGPDILRKPESSGRLVKNVSVEILDPETREVLPVGMTGLIKVYTPYASEAIIESGVSTSQEELGDGWGITGDLGFMDEDGFLTITGRTSDVILRGGVNVAPQELEAILRRHPWVDEVAAVGIPDAQYGQEIGLAIVASQGSVGDFHAYCMSNISPERRPRIIRLFQSLPHNQNGKLVRSKIVELLSENATDQL